MRYIIIVLLCCGTLCAQEYRQIYGVSTSMSGYAQSDSVIATGFAGQTIVGRASGGAYSAGFGLVETKRVFDIILDTPEGPVPLPTDFAFPQNYPNPFNPSTTFRFALPQQVRVRLTIFDLLGREVATLIDSELPAGNYIEHFQPAGNVASGLYFARFDAGNFHQMRKLVLIK